MCTKFEGNPITPLRFIAMAVFCKRAKRRKIPYSAKFRREKTLANLSPAPSFFRYYKQLADKILANSYWITKFTKVFSCQNFFVLYGNKKKWVTFEGSYLRNGWCQIWYGVSPDVLVPDFKYVSFRLEITELRAGLSRCKKSYIVLHFNIYKLCIRPVFWTAWHTTVHIMCLDFKMYYWTENF